MSTNDGGTYSNISGAIATSYSFAAAANESGDEYRAAFTNSLGTAYSNPATLTVNPVPQVTTNPASQTINAGLTVSFTAAATSTSTPSVQWQVSTNGGGTYSNISGATSTTYSFITMAVQTGDMYRAVFTNSAGGTADTSPATLTVNPVPQVTLNPVSQAVNAGQSVTLTAAAIGSPTPTVQWMVKASNATPSTPYTSIPGATSTTYTFTATAAESGNMYAALFTNSLGIAYTNPAALTVNATPVVTLNPVNQAVPAGQPVTFTAATSTSAATVQWQVSTNNGSSYSNISGATSATYTFSTLANQTGNLYRAAFSNAAGTTYTNPATLTCNIFPVVLTNPVSQSVAAGQSVTLSATVAAIPAATVQWQVSTNQGSTYTNIPGATSAAYTFQAIAGESGNLYRAAFTNSLGTAYANPATLTVSSTPVSPLTVTTNPASETVFAGTTASFTAAATGSPAPSVQWQVKAGTGALFVNIPGATSTTYSFTAVAAESGNQYQAVFTNAAGSTATTTAAALKVNSVASVPLPKPKILVGPAPAATSSATPALATTIITTTTTTSTPSAPAAAPVQASTLAAVPVKNLSNSTGVAATPSRLTALQPAAVDVVLQLL